MPARFLELMAGDVELIDAELRTLCARAGAEAVVLLDMSGAVLGYHRIPESIDVLMFSALLASNFAATEELSRKLGVTDFRVIYHEGRRQNLYFDKVSPETVLVVLFKDSNALGRVRLFCEKSVPELGKRIAEITKHPEAAEQIEQGRQAAASIRDIVASFRAPKGGS